MELGARMKLCIAVNSMDFLGITSEKADIEIPA